MLRSKSLPRDCCADCCVYLADGSIQVGIYDFNLGCEVPPVDAGSAESVLELVDEGLNPVQLMDIEPYLCASAVCLMQFLLTISARAGLFPSSTVPEVVF